MAGLLTSAAASPASLAGQPAAKEGSFAASLTARCPCPERTRRGCGAASGSAPACGTGSSAARRAAGSRPCTFASPAEQRDACGSGGQGRRQVSRLADAASAPSLPAAETPKQARAQPPPPTCLGEQHVARVAVQRGDEEDAAAAVGHAEAGRVDDAVGPALVPQLHKLLGAVLHDGRVAAVAVEQRLHLRATTAGGRARRAAW